MTHVFLSPHLDDGVFSCGGTIHQLVQQSKSVIILTLLAGDPPDTLPQSPILIELYQRWQAGESPIVTRRQEDIASAMALGATPIHEPYLDCVYRQHDHQLIYASEESLFGDIHPDDPLPAQLQRQTTSFLQQFPNIDCLYTPLGVGHHVDHQIVRDWGIAIYKQNPELCVKFYEEYPYTRDVSAISKAQAHIPNEFKLKSEIIALSEGDITAKTRAVACHQSQISTFWNSVDSMSTEIQKMFRMGEGNAYAERFWTINDQ